MKYFLKIIIVFHNYIINIQYTVQLNLLQTISILRHLFYEVSNQTWFVLMIENRKTESTVMQM